jgi:hypothetical protein
MDKSSIQNKNTISAINPLIDERITGNNKRQQQSFFLRPFSKLPFLLLSQGAILWPRSLIGFLQLLYPHLSLFPFSLPYSLRCQKCPCLRWHGTHDGQIVAIIKDIGHFYKPTELFLNDR